MWIWLINSYQVHTTTPLAILMKQCIGKSSEPAERVLGNSESTFISASSWYACWVVLEYLWVSLAMHHNNPRSLEKNYSGDDSQGTLCEVMATCLWYIFWPTMGLSALNPFPQLNQQSIDFPPMGWTLTTLPVCVLCIDPCCPQP